MRLSVCSVSMWLAGGGVALASALSTAGCGGDGNLNLSTGAGASGGSGGSGTSTTSGGSGGTGGDTTTSTSTGTMQNGCVVDGMVQGFEECDDGNMVDFDGCNNDCTFTCVKGTIKGDAKCDDTDPCNGAETCTDQHTCMKGTAAADGTSCGSGKICKAGVCGDDTCGDGFTAPGEECDDGNVLNGDGCDTSCTFSCTGADPSKCAPPDPCQGVPACDDATHTCKPLMPLSDGAACGMGGTCLMGKCKVGVCGDGALDPGEQCDDGNAVNGDGCEMGCTFSCNNAANDCPAPPPCQIASCTAQHTCAVGPDAAQNGMSCPGGAGFVCNGGACSAPGAVCGNGTKEAGEDCDFGAGNGPGTGCETTCKLSCTMSPDSCPDANSCNGVEVCQQVTVNGKVGQKCNAGTPLANCAACAGGFCGNGVCKASSCGDGCVDAASGEQCEPPNTPTCSATCQNVVVAACGNGTRDGTEQCDDGNTTNLDGCDSACKFEQDQRVDYFKMQFATDAYCTVNALGGAFVGLAQTQVQSSLDTGISDGSIGILFKMINLDDLSGTADPAVTVGVLDGAPQKPMGAPMYSGTADLDWWYTASAMSIDAMRNPITSLPGTISAKVLNAGPGTVTLNLLLGGQPAALKISNTKVTGTIGATSTPLVSMGLPPGHLASEHLDPALVSYATCGQTNANGAAKLCGNVSAASLAQVPIPAALTMGITACSQGYTATSSILDVLIGGCTVLFMNVIKVTQPDQVDASAPPAGAGGPYHLSAGAGKVVNTCKDKNNVTVPLAACLNAAAYSSFFKFATDRVIVK